jgi:hypothetical protein
MTAVVLAVRQVQRRRRRLSQAGEPGISCHADHLDRRVWSVVEDALPKGQTAARQQLRESLVHDRDTRRGLAILRREIAPGTDWNTGREVAGEMCVAGWRPTPHRG